MYVLSKVTVSADRDNLIIDCTFHQLAATRGMILGKVRSFRFIAVTGRQVGSARVAQAPCMYASSAGEVSASG